MLYSRTAQDGCLPISWRERAFPLATASSQHGEGFPECSSCPPPSKGMCGVRSVLGHSISQATNVWKSSHVP